MRAPTPSEPKSNIFPTYQVPQESAMRGGALQPAVQDDEEKSVVVWWEGRADPSAGSTSGVTSTPSIAPEIIEDAVITAAAKAVAAVDAGKSVIFGSGRGPASNYSNVGCETSTTPYFKLQSVKDDNCLLNSVTVPKIQRNDRDNEEEEDGDVDDETTVAHNNLNNNNNVDSDKVDDRSKFGAALPRGRPNIPNQKSDDLEVLDALKADLQCDDNDMDEDKSTDIGDYMCHKRVNLRTISDNGTLNGTAPLRLRGGGESSLSTGTSGWGTPPSQQANNNNMNNSSGWGNSTSNPSNQNNTGTQQWNNNANRPPASSQSDANKTNAGGQQPPTSQSNATGWGQPGAKPQANGGNSASASSAATTTAVSTNNNAQNNAQTSAPNTTKQQLEQLNNMREAIFSTDGWGSQYVNQDSTWDVPASPEPPLKMDGPAPPPWKPVVNNGTELWETNLRNGGQPPPQPQQKTPWGHTPSTNIGGTWGEDDDASDSSNVWTGVPNNQQQWGNNNSNAMWGDSSKRVAGGAANASGWGDPRAGADPRAAAAAAAVAAMDGMRPDLRVAAAAAASGLDPRQLDPREQMRQMAGGDMRGDPRGITGRLNGAGAEFWGQAAPHSAPMHHQAKMPVGPSSTTGWEEPSPPTSRRTILNYDDGTSLWGNPQPGAGAMGGRGGGPPGMAPGRKPDGVWGGGNGGAGGGGRNEWMDIGGPGGGGGAGGGWGDEPGPAWAKQQKSAPGALWDPTELDGWSNHKPPQLVKPLQLTKEQVWNSKQFRTLVDMGYKKEDVENALRVREMNMEEALEVLSMLRGRGNDGWNTGSGGPAGRHDDHFEHNQFAGVQRGGGGYPGLGGPAGNPLGSSGFPPGAGLLNSMGAGSGQGNNSLINNISPAVVQKMLAQPGGGGVGNMNAQGYVGSGGGRPQMQPQSQPSTQQLRMLVQQIQMAVQAGYLNHQILNQPLAPQTLVLLNQLLQQIKNLQQLNNQQQLAAQSSKGNMSNPTFMQLSVLITKSKQHIMNIQNQIQAQQAQYVKQQQQGNIYDLKPNAMHESINSLQNNFADLALNKDPLSNQQQSRLNQWINKDKDDGSEFSRAPGSSSKPVATSPNMAPLGLAQADGPWSSGRSADTGWPDSSGVDVSNDVKDAQWPAATQPSLTDLVPEFEPGKPWKGNQIKSIEDDPSITPGSVVRSPLSVAGVKDNELFSINSSKSPPATDAMQSLISSTWSFNPPSTSSAFTSPPTKLPANKAGLGDLNPGTAVTSELWVPKSRGPPPGLSGKGSGGGSLANGWPVQLGGNNGNSSAPWSGAGNAAQRNSGNWGGSGGTSQWLWLKNLTAQIDGSTLRTLCMQHGPLLSFHLHLHQGFALAKYSSREEATKAQTALNNCVLGNTTILAENPTDWDANTILQSIANQQGGSSGGWRNSSSKPGGDTWSTGWPNNSSNLWGNLDSADPARATPSSLTSYLPNDLLGGESM